MVTLLSSNRQTGNTQTKIMRGKKFSLLILQLIKELFVRRTQGLMCVWNRSRSDFILLILCLCITIGLLIESVYPQKLPCGTCLDSVLPFPNAEQQRSPSWSPPPELDILTSAKSWFHFNPLCIICLLTEKRVYPEDLPHYTYVDSVLPSPKAHS